MPEVDIMKPEYKIFVVLLIAACFLSNGVLIKEHYTAEYWRQQYDLAKGRQESNKKPCRDGEHERQHSM